MTNKTETVTISKEEYDELLDKTIFIEALESMGVDNWEGYDEACEIYHEMKREQ